MWGGLVSRFLTASVLGIAGWRLALFIAGRNESASELTWVLAITIGATLLGFIIAPTILMRSWRLIGRRIKLIPAHSLVSAALGLAFALVITALITLPLSMLPGRWGEIAPLGAAIFFILLFVPIMLLQGPSALRFFFSSPLVLSGGIREKSELIILDTNAIIDGRIADIVQTGFIQGTLVVPRFVLDELRHIADSSDQLRRNRGRRGLEMLTQLQKGSDIPVQISDIDFDDIPDVDSKLVMLAKTLRCPIVSNDVNLDRVAALQGIKVLNINELANAVKPVVLQGEDVILRIVQEGKESGQGIGFLDDGTMVVVEGGRRYLNMNTTVLVTRVLQTAAGRMIFAQVKETADGRSRR